jgi:ppGpp synthetase/RelA/SpoT-type nucleotidyltranferase
MTLDEYDRFGQKIYADLADFIAKALSDGLEAKRSDIRLQHVKTRPKGLTSLREKLEKNGVAPDDQRIEEKIKDLAGCRLVFYTNTASIACE